MVPSPGRTFAAALLIALLACLNACSREQPPSEAHSNAPITPELSSQDPLRAPDSGAEVMLTADLNAGGIPSRYEAHFAEEQLHRIDESRTRGDEVEVGVYQFYGARLLRYDGAGLLHPTRVRLELDMQGRVTTALADGAPANAAEISAIRARAQLLRSHALTQRATRSHERAQPATQTY